MVDVSLLIFPCTIESRSSLLAPAHLGGPGKRAVKWLWWWLCSSLSFLVLYNVMASVLPTFSGLLKQSILLLEIVVRCHFTAV